MTKHVCMTPKECRAIKPHNEDRQDCPVCDWGLGVCKNCGGAESQLSAEPDCDKLRAERGKE